MTGRSLGRIGTGCTGPSADRRKTTSPRSGTFGIGLKSAFHICEAFLYIGSARSKWLAGVLNPWAGTGDDGQADLLHPDWDEVGERDVERLRIAMTELLGETDDGLLLWIPVRLDRHRDRGTDGRFGLGNHCPESQELCSWFGCSTPAALLLAHSADIFRRSKRSALRALRVWMAASYSCTWLDKQRRDG